MAEQLPIYNMYELHALAKGARLGANYNPRLQSLAIMYLAVLKHAENIDNVLYDAVRHIDHGWSTEAFAYFPWITAARELIVPRSEVP